MDKLRTVVAILNMGTRKFIALALTLLFIFLSFTGKVDGVQVTTIYGVIIGFYFGKSTALDDPLGRITTTEKGE